MDDKRLEAAAQEEKREYFRRWRKNNPDKVKKHNENYWRKRAEKRRGSARYQALNVVTGRLPKCRPHRGKRSIYLEYRGTATAENRRCRKLDMRKYTGILDQPYTVLNMRNGNYYAQKQKPVRKEMTVNGQ